MADAKEPTEAVTGEANPAASQQPRDASKALLRKLSVNLLNTYTHINEVLTESTASPGLHLPHSLGKGSHETRRAELRLVWSGPSYLQVYYAAKSARLKDSSTYNDGFDDHNHDYIVKAGEVGPSFLFLSRCKTVADPQVHPESWQPRAI